MRNLKNKIKSEVSEASTATSNVSTSTGLLAQERIKANIIIHDSLKTFIAPLDKEEFSQLEQNILANGCKDSLVIWQTYENILNSSSELDEQENENEIFVLIDGHNRYEICQKHGLSFNIVLVHFNTLKEVHDYMIDLQLGRRNLTPDMISYYRGVRYNREKKYTAESREKGKGDGEGEKTSERLAKKFNVSEKTIRRDAEFAEGLNKIEPTLKNEILAGSIKVPKSKISKLGKIEVESEISSLEDIDSIISTKDEEIINDTFTEDKVTFEETGNVEIEATLNEKESDFLDDVNFIERESVDKVFDDIFNVVQSARIEKENIVNEIISVLEKYNVDFSYEEMKHKLLEII